MCLRKVYTVVIRRCWFSVSGVEYLESAVFAQSWQGEADSQACRRGLFESFDLASFRKSRKPFSLAM
jgi:hypothetical protein